MKKSLQLLLIFIFTLGYGQTNCESLKNENENLQSSNKSLTSENEYLKKVLDINKPILEMEKENSVFKITKIAGNKTENRFAITFLVESINENKKMTIEDFSIIDVEGNEYQVDYFKSSRPYPDLALNVPMKFTFLFKDTKDKPLIIKLFRFKTKSQPERNLFESIKSSLEFRDLKVIWN